MIEGTEFVVRVEDKATDITVLEGSVVAGNESGSVKLNASESAHAQAGRPPLRTVEVKPLDAVAWALYYPPLPAQPSAADELAQASVAATVQNRLTDARALAQQALAADGSSAAAYMARSYVEQASFDIPSALADMQKAAELAPSDVVVRARLAELRMMTGDLHAARQVAAQAVCLDPGLSLAHDVLGFASLREVDLDAAERAFRQAIALDSAAPLPRLGLGLVKIRQGDLRSGREEIETAVLLDPNKALLRSYMGKAYYEEKRDELALEQLSMAKALDANDPTAWYYESILLQSVNRPVEALQAQRKAIELNDNRGVYRSRQLLDQDEAARTAS
jgi:tetratricopeptide (TPR) repeat protein